MGETQALFATHFLVSRETYRRWEAYGPRDDRTAMFIRMVLRKLDNRARQRERWRAWKRRQRAVAKNASL
jgi:hypothetical protein